MEASEFLKLFHQGQKDFSGADLHWIRLKKMRMDRIIFAKANLADADLSGSELFAADLHEANLNHTHLGITHNSSAEPNLDDIDIELGCIHLTKAGLHEASLVEAPMFAINRASTDLTGAYVNKGTLKKADTTNALLDSLIVHK